MRIKKDIRVGSPAEVTKTQMMVYEMKVADVMSKNTMTIRPKELMSTLREVFRSNRISGLPVVDGERLVGLVSLEDFINWLANKEEDCPIEEKMTEEIATIFDDDPLVLAIGRFEEFGFGRFPVLSRDKKRLVGILTKGDVIEGLLRRLEIDYQEEQIRGHRASHIFEDIQADSTTLLFCYDVVGKDFKRAGTTSSRLKRTLKRLGMRPDIVRRIAIASYEAEINLVVFTEGGEICARVQPTEVFIEVEDSGPGIADLEKALQPGYSTAPDWVRELGFGAGMGLNNIQKTADRFEIQSELGKGTLLRVFFDTGGAKKHETG